MAGKVDLDVLGVIENMSGFTTPDGERFTIFGEGGGQALADELDVPLLGTVPLQEALREHSDDGDAAGHRGAAGCRLDRDPRSGPRDHRHDPRRAAGDAGAVGADAGARRSSGATGSSTGTELPVDPGRRLSRRLPGKARARPSPRRGRPAGRSSATAASGQRVETVAVGREPDLGPASGRRLLAVAAGQGRDRAQLPLLPEDLVGEGGDLGHVDAGADDDPPPRAALAPRRRRRELACRGEDDRRVERLRRLLVREAGPLAHRPRARSAPSSSPGR